jgi:hypothetical protein
MRLVKALHSGVLECPDIEISVGNPRSLTSIQPGARLSRASDRANALLCEVPVVAQRASAKRPARLLSLNVVALALQLALQRGIALGRYGILIHLDAHPAIAPVCGPGFQGIWR